jgi:plastocyanin
MERRETRAQPRAGGGASPPARWLPLSGAAAVVALAVTAAPAGGGVAVGSSLAPATVTASNYQFAPRDVTINQGETVTWTNADGTHNVHFQDGFAQPAAPDNSSWSVTRRFDVPATYSYVCDQHANMTGTVTVNPAAGAPPPGGTPPPPSGGGYPPPGGGTQPGAPAPGAPGAPGGGKVATTVTLRVSDATPTQGARVRFFGTVKPAQDGRFVQLQRRTRGAFRTVLRIKLTDAGTSRSKFSKRVRVLGDAAFRARLPADGGHELGTSRARRLAVH